MQAKILHDNHKPKIKQQHSNKQNNKPRVYIDSMLTSKGRKEMCTTYSWLRKINALHITASEHNWSDIKDPDTPYQRK